MNTNAKACTSLLPYEFKSPYGPLMPLPLSVSSVRISKNRGHGVKLDRNLVRAFVLTEGTSHCVPVGYITLVDSFTLF